MIKQKTIAISYERCFFILLVLFYSFIIDIVHRFYVAPTFSYLGYIYISINPFYEILLYMLTVIPIFWLPIKLIRPSQIIYMLLYVLVYIPVIISMPHMFPGEIEYAFAGLSVIFFGFYIAGFAYSLPIIRIPRILKGTFKFWSFFIVTYIFLFIIIVYNFGFDALSRINFHLSLQDVYSVRMIFREQAAKAGRFGTYPVYWIVVLSTFLMGFGLTYRKVHALVIGTLGALLVFSITGFKSTLFSGLLMVAITLLTKKRQHFGVLIVLGMIFVVVISWLTDILLSSQFLVSLFVRRMILTPALLTGYYFDFFSINQKAFLGYSILRGIVEYPYDLAPPFLIGEMYFNNPVTSANVNIFGDAFANFGFIGILVYSFSLTIILWTIDSLARDKDVRLTVLPLALPAFSLTNSGLLTVIMTHGLGLATLLVYLLPVQYQAEKDGYNIDE